MKPAGLRNVFALFVLCICMAAVFGCSEAPPPEQNSRRQKRIPLRPVPSFEVDTLRLEGRDWGYPSPFAHYPRGPGGFKMCLIFDSLLERDEKGLIPWLAQTWSIDDNGLTYRFVVRKNVTWQDGAPLTVDDVVFSLNYASRHAPTWSYIFDAVQSVTAEDEHTVRVGLKQPHASMLYNLGRTRIIPKHIWEKVDRPKEFTTPEAVIGCGPYRLTDYSKAHGTYRFEAYRKLLGPRASGCGVLEYHPGERAHFGLFKGGDRLCTGHPRCAFPVQGRPGQQNRPQPGFLGLSAALEHGTGGLSAGCLGPAGPCPRHRPGKSWWRKSPGARPFRVAWG